MRLLFQCAVVFMLAGCSGTMGRLGKNLPLQHLDDGRMPLRFDAVYVYEQPAGVHGLPATWFCMRFWPNGRVRTWSQDPAPGGPTAGDYEFVGIWRGRYVVVGNELRMEFSMPAPDNFGHSIRTHYARFEPDGGFSTYGWHHEGGLLVKPKFKYLASPEKFDLRIVGPMKSEPDW